MSLADSHVDLRESGVLVSPQPPARVPPRRTPPPAPHSVKPSATPTEPIATEPDGAPEESLPSATGFRIGAIPGWLISLVVHLVLLIALALWMVPQVLRVEPQMLEVGIAEIYALEKADSFTIQPLDTADTNSAAAPSGDVGELSDLTANLGIGDAAQIAGSSPSLEAIDVGGMQDLFASSGAGMKDVGVAGQSAEFFGVKAGGRKFVFVVDSSNSMRGQKFTDAKKELMAAVRKLKKTQSFYVIFFDQDALRMFADNNREAEPRALPATPDNISKLERWLYFVNNERRTDPYDAVKFALAMRPDAIYILSDGQFTDRGRTEDFLKKENVINDAVLGYVPRVTIHTVGFYSKEGEETLSAIAKAYKGTYRFVPKPNGKN